MLDDHTLRQTVLRSIAIRREYVDTLAQQIKVREKDIRAKQRALKQLQDETQDLRDRRDAAEERLITHLRSLKRAGMLDNVTLYMDERSQSR